MSEQTDPKPRPDPPARPRRKRGGTRFAVLLCILVGLGIAWLGLTGRPHVLPDWITAQIERRLGAGAGGAGVDLGSAVLEVARDGATKLRLNNLALSGPDGASLGQFNTLRVDFDREALLRGALRPTALGIGGGQLTVRRAADGAFGVRLGGGAEAMGDLASLLDRVDAAFAAPGFAPIGRITAEDLTLTLEDARSGRLWQATDGRIDLRNGPESVAINLISEVFDGTETLASVQLSLTSRKESRAAILTSRVKDIPARDIALQAPALAFLGALDARVSGALRAVIAGDGTLESLDGTLDIGAGALQPAPEAHPLPFSGGRVYFSYDPGQEKLVFSEISLESATLRAAGTGHAYLRDFDGAWPSTLLAQIRLDRLVASPEGVFADAVAFEGGSADLRLRLAPFSVDFGQVVLRDGPLRVDGSGRVAVGPEGWEGSVDLATAEIAPDRILALWPLALGPKTRGWLSDNLAGGHLRDVVGAVRFRPGSRPNFGFSFDYEAAEVRFLPHMPPVTRGSGYATLHDSAFTVTVEEGAVAATGSTPVAVGGSSFRIEDVFATPGEATLRLGTVSSLEAVLRAMDNPPFEVLRKSGRPADLLEAEARLETLVRFPLEKDLDIADVDFRVAGTLTGVSSETLVPNRSLAADTLDIEVRPDRLSLSGAVRVDGVPVEATFVQPMGPGSEGAPARLTGTVALAAPFYDLIGLRLPPDTVSGEGRGTLALELPRDAAPSFDLSADLAGLALRIPPLGWSKPAPESGTLAVTGRLGPTPVIETIQLDAPGLAAEGRIVLGEGGAFETAAFDRVRAGTWLDAPVRIEGRGPGEPPRIVVEGGSLDVARLAPESGGGGRVPLSLSLDTLRITDRLALSAFTGEITAGGGLDGRFRARVNGGAPIAGTLVPQRGRTAIRIQGENAGAILRDAGVFRSLDGGSFDLILAPRAEAEGFEGQLRINSALLGDQSIVVDMLDAVSVVGLLDQMRGAGVLFDTIESRFRLAGDRLTITQGSAVGASLGVSLDGTYDIAANSLDLQGVMSPIYLLNSIGSIFTRRGEGLFGFTFTITGAADAPRVAVNPLSILTPGMFREIFRRAPPE